MKKVYCAVLYLKDGEKHSSVFPLYENVDVISMLDTLKEQANTTTIEFRVFTTRKAAYEKGAMFQAWIDKGII